MRVGELPARQGRGPSVGVHAFDKRVCERRALRARWQSKVNGALVRARHRRGCQLTSSRSATAPQTLKFSRRSPESSCALPSALEVRAWRCFSCWTRYSPQQESVAPSRPLRLTKRCRSLRSPTCQHCHRTRPRRTWRRSRRSSSTGPMSSRRPLIHRPAELKTDDGSEAEGGWAKRQPGSRAGRSFARAWGRVGSPG